MNWCEFSRCIAAIKELSDTIFDGWTLHGNLSEENSAYITKKSFLNLRELNSLTEENSYKTKESFVENKESRYSSNTDNSVYTIEHHVTYSCSYGVPLLSLNAWNSDGNILTMEECWKVLGIEPKEEVYSMLTQIDHPVLQKPFLTLHPCKTEEIMNTFKSSKNLVVSWLSAIGPTVKLNLDNVYNDLATK